MRERERVTYHPFGERAEHIKCGDILLVGIKQQGLVSLAIKFGALLRGIPKPYRRFSHVALVLHGNGTLVEALVNGVRMTNVSHYDAADYAIVHTYPAHLDQHQITEYALSVIGHHTRYGFWTIAGLALYCLTGAQLCIQQAGSAICSGFVSDALTRAGYVWPRPPFAMMPADLAAYFKVSW